MGGEEFSDFENAIVRPVRAVDIDAVAEIYNHYVVHSTCTFATQAEGSEYWQKWLTAHDEHHPAIVAEHTGRILGWASLSQWNNRCAYRFSAEDSVYVRPDLHRRGVGRLLLGELIDRGRQIGMRSIVAQIADHQAASEKLHAAFGFRLVGHLEAIGFKFDRWIDVGIWQWSL